MAIPNLGAGINGQDPRSEKVKDEKALDFDKWTQNEEGNNSPTYSFNINLKNYDEDMVDFSTKYIDLYDTNEDKKWDIDEFIKMSGAEDQALGTYREDIMTMDLTSYYNAFANNAKNIFNYYNKNNDDYVDASEFAAMLSAIDKQDGKKDGIITYDNYAEIVEIANEAAPKETSEEVSKDTNEAEDFDDKEDKRTINNTDGSRVEETTKYINGQIAVVNKKEYLANGTLQNEYELIYDKSGTGEIVEKAGIWHNPDGTTTDYTFTYEYNAKGEKTKAKLHKETKNGPTHDFDITYAADGSEALREETKIDPETGNIIIGRYDDIGRLLYEEEIKSGNPAQKVRETYYKIEGYKEKGSVKSQTLYDNDGKVIENDNKSNEIETYPEGIKTEDAKEYYDLIKSGNLTADLLKEIRNNTNVEPKELSILLKEAEENNPELFS